jgi:hypothetical protein
MNDTRLNQNDSQMSEFEIARNLLIGESPMLLLRVFQDDKISL